MIFLFGHRQESVIKFVKKKLEQKQIKPVMVSQEILGNKVKLIIRSKTPSHIIIHKGRKNYISAKDIIINRLSIYEPSLDTFLNIFINSCPARVYNSYDTNIFVSSKPLQLVKERVLDERWKRPKTLITNQKNKIIGSYQKKWIFKSMGGQRSIVTKYLTNAPRCNLENLKSCPVLFQEYIDAHTCLKVHNFGLKTYSIQIKSNNTDYRYEKTTSFYHHNGDCKIRTIAKEIRQKTGIDYFDFDLLKRGSKYFFLEVNASPAPSDFKDVQKSKLTDKFINFLL